MKRQAIPWAVALFFITLLSCEKDKADPECKDASCCNPEYNQYVEYITDVPAHLAGPPQYSRWGVRVSRGYPSGTLYATKVLTICESSMGKITNFSPEIVPSDSSKIAYSYLVSGKVLADVTTHWNTITPVLYIYIDKIEKIKP